ncbi:MAG: hypothetical protein U1E92_06645 [Moraxella osloensis]
MPEAQRNYVTQPNKVSGWLIAFGVSLAASCHHCTGASQRIGYHRGLSFAAEEAKKPPQVLKSQQKTSNH